MTIHRRKVPIGDPTCPPEVRLAKHVKVLIAKKEDLGEGEREYDMERNKSSVDVEVEGSGDELDEGHIGDGIPETVTTTSESVGIRERLIPRRKPPNFSELMLLQMKADLEQRAHVAAMQENKRKEVNNRREDEREDAARVRKDDRKEAIWVRADKRNERVLDWTTAISLISSIVTGYFTMATEVQGGKRRRLHKNR